MTGRVDLTADESVVVSSSAMRLTRDQQQQFTRELVGLQQRMIEASKRTADARDRGEDTDDEAVQLLLVLSPDVLAPD